MRALVVIPTYNERENIQLIIPRILELPFDLRVLVVDDASPDGTGEIVAGMARRDPRIDLLSRERKMGLGSAYVAGFQRALAQEVDLVIQMDADLSHDPAAIEQFQEAIRDADLVVGSRYMNGVRVVNWPIRRLILSYGANLYTRVVTGMPLSDATGGYKCFRRCALEAIDLDRVGSDGYAFQIEMNFLCWRRGLRLREIPIVFVDRQRGASKLSRRIIWEALWLVWRLGFTRWLGMRPRALCRSAGPGAQASPSASPPGGRSARESDAP